MKDQDKYKLDKDKLKAFATNAVTDKTRPESGMPVSSDNSVKEARDWGNNGSRL